MTSNNCKIKDSNGKIIYEGTERRVNRNGNGKLTYWLLGAIFAICLIFISGVLADSSENARQLQRDSNRISILETQQIATNQQLDRIEDKLDKLISQSLGYYRK